MNDRNKRLAKALSLPVLAVCGFLVAATFAGVGLGTTTTTDTTTTETTTTTTETTTTTTTTVVGNEGCTPGFWKNHLGAWVGFSPGQDLESVFDVPDSLEIDNRTLLQALQTGGGGVTALMRHAVAAILNAAHPSVDYPIEPADAVIALVNAALASGSASTIESLKNTLDTANNLHAPGFCD